MSFYINNKSNTTSPKTIGKYK